MSLELDQSKLQDRNYVSGFFDLLKQFAIDSGEVLSTLEIVSKSPFIPSLGIFDVTCKKNLRLYPKAILHTEPDSPYPFLAQIVSYEKNTGKVRFEVIAIDYWKFKKPSQVFSSRSDGKFTTKLVPSGVINLTSNATVSTVPVANGGTGSSNVTDFVEISNTAFLENFRVSTDYFYEDFLSIQDKQNNFLSSIGNGPRNADSGSKIQIVGNFRNHMGSSNKTTTPVTLGGSTMGRRAGFIELLAGGANPASSAIYLGRSAFPNVVDGAGTLGTFANSSSNSNNLSISIDFLVRTLSTLSERYLIEIGVGSIFGGSLSGLWTTYVDNENSGRPVLNSRSNYLQSLLTSNSGSPIVADTWHSLKISSSGTSFNISVDAHSVTRAFTTTVPFYIFVKLTKVTGSGVASLFLDYISYRRSTTLAGRRA